jgi:cyclophilin family peptidyl-prolyl cis-trans isomerase
MAQIRRPQRNQQRVILVRLFLAIGGIFFFAVFLFQFDGFPERKKALRMNHQAVQPLLTPDKLLAQDFIRQHQRVDALGGSEPASRRFKILLGGLSHSEGDENASGTVVIETRPSWAPIGVAHLHELMEANFYTQCRFFRVIPNFMVQFGIAADPQVQKEWRQNVLQDDPVKQTNARGTVSFATSGKNTRTTQLFINTKASGNAYLDKEGFAPVAVVGEGMEIIDTIYAEYKEKPVQQKIVNQGNVYLDKEFPLLSYIESIEEITSLPQDEAAVVAEAER